MPRRSTLVRRAWPRASIACVCAPSHARLRSCRRQMQTLSCTGAAILSSQHHPQFIEQPAFCGADWLIADQPDNGGAREIGERYAALASFEVDGDHLDNAVAVGIVARGAHAARSTTLTFMSFTAR